VLDAARAVTNMIVVSFMIPAPLFLPWSKNSPPGAIVPSNWASLREASGHEMKVTAN
jgi:hypothetical protein